MKRFLIGATALLLAAGTAQAQAEHQMDNAAHQQVSSYAGFDMVNPGAAGGVANAQGAPIEDGYVALLLMGVAFIGYKRNSARKTV